MKKISLTLKYAVLALIIVTTFSNMAFSQQTNFSGNWTLNEQKSDFKGQPAATMFKQITAEQTATELKVTGTTFTSTTPGKTTAYPLNCDKLMTVLSSKRTMTAMLTWQDNKTLVRNSSYSLPDQPSTKDYSSKETWTLSADGKELHLEREFNAGDHTLTILAVYDKH